jgi:hypothetical protein
MPKLDGKEYSYSKKGREKYRKDLEKKKKKKKTTRKTK